MRSSLLILTAGSLFASVAVARAEAPTRSPVDGVQAPEVLGWLGTATRPDGKPGDLMQVIPPVTQQPATTAWVLYLNKNGGTFTPGDNDSRTNSSSIPSQTSVIQPWNISDANWQTVVSCIKDEFAQFDITVTDVDPGQTPHIEAVIAGNPADVQMPSNVGGVSPFTIDCTTIPNSIVYAFANLYGNDYQTVCEVAAQEIAHSFGLDHEYLASDPMTYLDYNGHKTFQNTTASCGEYSTRACGLVTQGYPSCRANQNSVQLLTQRIGVGGGGGGDTVAPTISITSPRDGATVSSGFAVIANATDDVGVVKVELYIDGALVDTKTAAPFSFNAPGSLTTGSHIVETRAYDSANTASSKVTVTLADAGGGSGSGSGSGSGGGTGGGTGGGSGSAGDGSYVVGGCAAAGGSPGSLLVLGLVGLGLGIRRRRR